MTTTDPTTAQPATPADALRWYASRAVLSPEGHAWAVKLRRWADELDTAPTATAPQPAPLDLTEIVIRANEATPGPWHEGHIDTDTCVHIGDYGWVAAGPNRPEYDVDSDQGRADAEFIAHARSDVPELVAEVRRLRAAGPLSTVPPAGTEGDRG